VNISRATFENRHPRSGGGVGAFHHIRGSIDALFNLILSRFKEIPDERKIRICRVAVGYGRLVGCRKLVVRRTSSPSWTLWRRRLLLGMQYRLQHGLQYGL
jgi:hypothetical protein